MSTLPDDMAENPVSASDPATIGIAAPPREKPRGLFGFWCLIATQFQGAFNDNALKAPWNCMAIRRSEEHTSELQSRPHLVCRPLLVKKIEHLDNIRRQSG